MAQLQDLEEPSRLADLGMRLAIIVILIVGLVVVTTTAYGSVEDLSGPATAPPTVTTLVTTSEATDSAVATPQTTLSLEAVPAPPPIRVLTPEELAAVEAESVEETDRSRLAPTGAVDESPATLPTDAQSADPEPDPNATDPVGSDPGLEDDPTPEDDPAPEDTNDQDSPSTTAAPTTTDAAPEPTEPAPTQPATSPEPAE